MGFVHGVVDLTSTSAEVGSGLETMLRAVGSLPGTSRGVQVFTSGPHGCALGVQSDPDRAGLDTSEGSSEQGVQLGIVTDVRLHERRGLAARLGTGSTDAQHLGDAALILRAYRRWDLASVQELSGEGTFVLWDARLARLLCWRDPSGAAPLYYHHAPGRRLVISSDLESLLAHPEVPRVLDLEYARALIEDPGFQHPSRTLCQDVRKLPAGHALVFENGSLRLSRYWNPSEVEERRYRDPATYAEELRGLVQEAVDDRLPIGTSGVGAHLSGGLDSSSLAVFAQRGLRSSGRHVTGFSWSPPWDRVPLVDDDERCLAELVANGGGFPLRFVSLQAGDVVEALCRDVAVRPTITLHFELATLREARQLGIGTLLSGWGGDESVVFNGRGYFADLARSGRLLTVQRELRRRQRINGGSILGAWRHRIVAPLLPEEVIYRTRLNDRPPRVGLPEILRPDVAELLRAVEPLELPSLRERPGVRNMQIALLRHGHLQHRMESWAAEGARRGVTYAFPLLDRRIVEFALSVPDHLYFKDGWKRWLYRTAMDGVLPDDVRWNPHKRETAIFAQMRQVTEEARREHDRQLRARKGNAFIDVDRVLDPPPATAAGGPKQPMGNATWLAFTDLSLPG